MNILYDHQIFNMQRYGGVSRYFYEIASRICQTENVYLYEGYHINEYGLENVENLDVIKAIKRKSIPKSGRIYDWFSDFCFKREMGKRKLDIYHPTYYRDYYCGNGKLVITVYDMIHELFSDYFPDANKTINEKENLIKKADKIIAISHSTKKDLMRIYNVPEKKIDVVYLANSLRYVVTTDRLIEYPYFLYVGTRFKYKNFERMLEAFALSRYSKELICVAFGGGEFSYEENELINRLKLQKRVVQINGDDSTLANLYKYAEVFVYPSEYEGFGLPLLEAMHYGTPVLTGNVSSIPEVAGDAASYFIPTEIDDIRSAMDKVFGDKHFQSDLSVKGVEREKQFSWERCAEETIIAYRKALY